MQQVVFYIGFTCIEVTDSGEVVKEFKLKQTKLENENADVQSKLRKLQEEYSKREAQVKGLQSRSIMPF